MGDNRERFEKELQRIKAHRFRRLLIVGREEDIRAGNYQSLIKPKAVLATVAAFEVRYDLPVVFARTPEDGGRQIEKWAFWFAREIILNAKGLMG